MADAQMADGAAAACGMYWHVLACPAGGGAPQSNWLENLRKSDAPLGFGGFENNLARKNASALVPGSRRLSLDQRASLRWLAAGWSLGRAPTPYQMQPFKH